MPRRSRPVRRGRYADLASYIAGSHDTQANIAAQVGVSQAVISRIANGLTIPRLELAMRLVAYCRIPLDSFWKTKVRKRSAA